jgi:16S rRNA processing protein RimM
MAELLEVGRITRPHGVRGDVLVALSTDLTSRLDAGSVLSTDRGDVTVARSSRHNDRWIVAFAEIDGRDDAERWRGTILRAEPAEGDEAGDDDVLWVHRLVGASVETTDGTVIGPVVAVQANPASDLLELEGGTLVPVVFVVDHGAGRVVIDPPDGLLDL